MQDQQLKQHPVQKSLEVFTLLSHEIRTPLNAIVGISDLLPQINSESQKEEYYKVLQNTSENLLELVNNILDFSKLNSGVLEITNKTFDFRKKVRHSLYSQEKGAIAKGLGFNLKFDAEIPDLVNGDQVKVCQIFINLLSNAIKFTEEGQVETKIKLEKEDKNSLLLFCEVSDTGIGIPSHQLSRVFEAFNQGEQEININYAGTGLGLSITRKLITILGGKVWVESEPGHGTSFKFTLPLQKKQRDLMAATATA